MQRTALTTFSKQFPLFKRLNLFLLHVSLKHHHGLPTITYHVTSKDKTKIWYRKTLHCSFFRKREAWDNFSLTKSQQKPFSFSYPLPFYGHIINLEFKVMNNKYLEEWCGTVLLWYSRSHYYYCRERFYFGTSLISPSGWLTKFLILCMSGELRDQFLLLSGPWPEDYYATECISTPERAQGSL